MAFNKQRLANIRGMLPPQFIEACDLILLIGSHAEGLDSPRSDVDFMVVWSEAGIANGVGFRRLRMADGSIVDPLAQTTDDFARRLQQSKQPNFDKLEVRDIELIHKAAYGIPVKGDELHASLVAQNFDQANFRAKLMTRFTTDAIDAFDDLLGELSAGRSKLTAVEFLRQAVRWLIDAMLASVGSTYTKDKWRLIRVERAFGRDSPVYTGLCRLEFEVPIQQDLEIARWMRDTLRFAHYIQLRTHFGQEWDEKWGASAQPSQTGPIANPWMLMVPHEQNVLVRTHAKTLALDRLSALILILLSQAYSPDEIAVRLCGPEGGAEQESTRLAIEERVAALAEMQLVVAEDSPTPWSGIEQLL